MKVVVETAEQRRQLDPMMLRDELSWWTSLVASAIGTGWEPTVDFLVRAAAGNPMLCKDEQMNSLSWMSVHGVMMTSETIDAYGGFQVPREILMEIAVGIDAGGMPFHIDHRLDHPLRVRDLHAWVQTRPDGIDELRFSATVHPDDTRWVEEYGHVSVMMTTPIARDAELANEGEAAITVAADHSWFSDDALLAAEADLVLAGMTSGGVRVQRAFQFGLIPDPQIFIDVTWTALQSVGASAIWDGVKRLFRLRRKHPEADRTPTVINVTVRNGDRSVTSVVRTSDEAVAARAFDSLDRAVDAVLQQPVQPESQELQAPPITWDDPNRGWTPPI
ncbi:hypothetical protein [Curtobacterium flaccumfaciens]|uniref:hypothetical protein n=1 Tax=Curtobacterium flaccumfaciens TaxID=2035 RepID=UPI003991EBD0